MLAQLLEERTRKGVVSIIPYSGIQFLDFAFDANGLKSSLLFGEKEGAGGQRLSQLRLDQNTGDLLHDDGGPVRQEEEIRLNAARVLQLFDGQWIPYPLLRIRGREANGMVNFARGPMNWSRLRLAALPRPDEAGNSHRVTVAVDTEPLPYLENRPYLAPSEDNIRSGEEFMPASRLADIAWFWEEAWFSEWIREVVDNHLMRQYGDSHFAVRRQHIRPLEPWAYYVAFQTLLAEAEILPVLRFTDTVSKPPQFSPIDVDLVLDVGNSRTCGFLVESGRDERIDLNNSYSLEIRDLSRPEYVYRDPFPSRIEFSRVSFGNDRLSRRSGRQEAFSWPMLARIGWEASFLSYHSEGTEGNTGLSSPKRYLWDTRKQHHEWRFNSFGSATPAVQPPVNTGLFIQYLNDAGEERAPREIPAVQALFSRSSLMMLFLSELFAHALMQINSVTQRGRQSHAAAPRRLRRLILTMPAAITRSERMLFTKRVRAAQSIVWKILQQPEEDTPEIVLQWDEATGTQVIFLYNEMKHKFLGNSSLFFAASRRKSEPDDAGSRLRIASMDIGGGTTDLIITTYELKGSQSLAPYQEFREGFNLAGDDILAAVIERHVLSCISEALKKSGVTNPETLLVSLFGPDHADQKEHQRTLRCQFAHQISAPVALRIIELYESYDPLVENSRHLLGFQDIFIPEKYPSARVLDYFQTAVAGYGVSDFSLEEVVFDVDLEAVDNTVRRTIGTVLNDLCEVVACYDCDYFLLSGRPSKMPAIRDLVISRMPVTVDRIITMHDYKVGSWYPYRNLRGQLADPKTTAAVGALVCALSMGYLAGFHLQSKDFFIRSTANYIGRMEDTGQILHQNLYFRDLSLDREVEEANRGAGLPKRAAELSATFDFYSPMFIGFRQLNIERWPATPLYRVEFANPEQIRRFNLPLKITIGLIPSDQDPQCKIFDIQMVTDSDGIPLANDTVVFRLQTMKNAQGYWLDTGIFLLDGAV